MCVCTRASLLKRTAETYPISLTNVITEKNIRRKKKKRPDREQHSRLTRGPRKKNGLVLAQATPGLWRGHGGPAAAVTTYGRGFGTKDSLGREGGSPMVLSLSKSRSGDPA